MGHDLSVTNHHLPTRDDLLSRKQEERAESDRPRERAKYEERELMVARTKYWELIGEFVDRLRELNIPAQRQAPVAGAGWIVWVEGYSLTGGAIASAPPLRYCTSERRLLARQKQVQEVDELSLFVVAAGDAGQTAQQTASKGNWPPVYRLDRTAAALTALERELEASLLALMD